MSTPLRHHFVPAFYLQQWVGDRGRLIEYSKIRSKLVHKSVGPRATGFQTSLYTLKDLPPESEQHLETTFFNSVDNAAAQALYMHLGLSDVKWSAEKRNAWTLFIMSMQLRHPDVIADLVSAIAQIWADTEPEFARQYQGIRARHHPETYDDYIRQRGPHDDAWGRVRIVEHAFKEKAIRDRINAMTWAVFDTNGADAALLTSDRPILIWDLEGIDGFVAMPISPSKIFIAANGQHNIDYISSRTPSELAFKNNKLVVEQARKYVWAIDDSLTSFVEQYMSTRFEPLPVLPSLSEREG